MFIILILFLFLISFIRLIYLLKHRNKSSLIKRTKPVKTMVCIGSGGHTKEMIQILEEINPELYKPRIYVIADSDTTSEIKIISLEHKFKFLSNNNGTNYSIKRITRSRQVNQKYSTSIITTLLSIFNSIPLVLKERPELILSNGPGTCVPICLIGFLSKFLFINVNCKIVFVESFCRVKSLSLSGKILIKFCDMFVVQWVQLQRLSNRINYFGRLM